MRDAGMVMTKHSSPFQLIMIRIDSKNNGEAVIMTYRSSGIKVLILLLRTETSVQ